MNLPAEQNEERALYVALKDVESQIRQVMPKEWDDDDLKRLLCTAALQSRKWGRNDQERANMMKGLDLGSFVEAVTNAASCNILPDGRRGYLIVRQSRSANGGQGGYEVSFQADYKGLMDVAKRADPRILNMHADVICANDDFEHIEGSERRFSHSISRDSLAKGRGEIQGAYCVVYYENNHYDVELLPLAELQKIMGMSAAKFGPNKDWAGEMHKKAAIRRMCKRLPETPLLAQVMNYENSIYDLSKPVKKEPKTLKIEALPEIKKPEPPRPERGKVRRDPTPTEAPGVPVPETVKETVEIFQGKVIEDEPKPKAKAKPKVKAKVKVKKKAPKKEEEEKVPDSFVKASDNIKERKAVESDIQIALTVAQSNNVDLEGKGYDDKTLAQQTTDELKKSLTNLEELVDESVPF